MGADSENILKLLFDPSLCDSNESNVDDTNQKFCYYKIAIQSLYNKSKFKISI
mgnify:CR=1 FL=1